MLFAIGLLASFLGGYVAHASKSWRIVAWWLFSIVAGYAGSRTAVGRFDAAILAITAAAEGATLSALQPKRVGRLLSESLSRCEESIILGILLFIYIPEILGWLFIISGLIYFLAIGIRIMISGTGAFSRRLR